MRVQRSFMETKLLPQKKKQNEQKQKKNIDTIHLHIIQLEAAFGLVRLA